MMSLCQLANNALKNLGRGGGPKAARTVGKTPSYLRRRLYYTRGEVYRKRARQEGKLENYFRALEFFATGFLLGFKMYIFLTLEFFFIFIYLFLATILNKLQQ